MTTAAATSTVSATGDLFNKGWDLAEGQEVKPTGEFAVVSASQSTASEPQQTAAQSAPASSVAASTQETQASSVSGSQSASIAQSEVNYEQKWKSSHGIIKSQSVALSKAASENMHLRANPAQAATTSQATSAAQSTVDTVDELEDQFMEALIDGKKTDALKIRKQIDKIKEDRFAESVRRNIAAEVDARTSEKLTETDEYRNIDIVKDTAYKNFPYLNNEGPAANPAAIRFVRATAAEYYQSGMSKHEALQEAVKDAAKIPWTTSAATSTAQTAAVSTADDKLASMVAVDTKSAPIKTDQKAEGKGSYDAGWSKAVPT